jgi:hypothetical protein
MGDRRFYLRGGKEVLLKAIAQAIPSYEILGFKIKGITKVMSNFWWGDGAIQKRMHWVAW